MTGFNVQYTCLNCGKKFKKGSDELMDSINYCGPCARHYLGLINEAMEKVKS